jgi:5,8-dihydroxy-2-naphthoate synthase
MKLTLGFSPCPNDTFIFDALVNKKIDAEGLSFDVIMDDVETLNQWALNGKLDVTKLSYGVLPLVIDNYMVLNSGSALGKGVGPILISNRENEKLDDEESTIAVPGEHTTAHLLFQLAYPNVKKKVFLRYDEIENYVLAGKGPGVIIHENRFTYAAKGLYKITDLGEYWENETKISIPLGGIVIKRSVDTVISTQIDSLIRKSIEYAYKNNYADLTEFVKTNSKEISEEIMRKHIDLYVNNYSIDLGEGGKKAIIKLLEVHRILKHEDGFSDAEIFIK